MILVHLLTLFPTVYMNIYVNDYSFLIFLVKIERNFEWIYYTSLIRQIKNKIWESFYCFIFFLIDPYKSFQNIYYFSTTSYILLCEYSTTSPKGSYIRTRFFSSIQVRMSIELSPQPTLEKLEFSSTILDTQLKNSFFSSFLLETHPKNIIVSSFLIILKEWSLFQLFDLQYRPFTTSIFRKHFERSNNYFF